MTEVRFYHLTRTSLEQALPQMLEKTLERGQRAVVIAGSDERAESLSASLWTYRDRSFLPHGTAQDGYGELQPVWLTAKDENPNGAQVLFLTDGASAQSIGDYGLCATLFDGTNDAAVAAARAQWKDLKAAGHEVTYWQQDDAGRWSQKA
ncbi:MAG: DNA polymerase III subunit chi [Pseudomonadota bacterium]